MIITDVWHAQPGDFFCMATKSPSGSFQDHWFNRSKFSEIRAFLRRHQGDNVYFCPHGFSQRKRQKEFAVMPHLLWADLDHVDPDVISPRPTVAIRSSPGRFVGLWMTDVAVSEELNQRLSYAIGSDKSGWDLTQLLRAPGSFNQKYPTQPAVKVMWRDGPGHSVKRLERSLPDAPRGETLDPTDAAAAFKRWEKDLPHWVRRELMTKKEPEEGKRSEMLFKLANTLLECGVPQDDGVLMLRSSLWNKYVGRRDEERQLGRTWDRATNKHMSAPRGKSKPKADEKEAYEFLKEGLDGVEPREIDWVWYPFFARGEVTIVQGDPGVGKSFLTQMAAGHICAGKVLPCADVSKERAIQGYVAYFDCENSRDTVTVHRLTHNGFGPHLRYFLQEERRFSIDSEEERTAVWEGMLRRAPTIAVFDTINTYIGKADTNQGSQTQQSFMWFREMAQEFNCAVIVLRHLTKGSRDKAMYRGQGSIAFTGVARIEVTIGRHPEEENVCVMAMDKTNLAPFPPALTYEIHRIKHRGHDRALFEFGDYIEMSAEDLVAPVQASDKSKPKDAELEAMIIDILKDGREHDAADIIRMAESRSFTERAVQRVGKTLGVTRRHDGRGPARVTFWSVNPAAASARPDHQR